MLLAPVPPEGPPGQSGTEMGSVRCGQFDLLSGAIGGSEANRWFTAATTTGRADLRKISVDALPGADRRLCGAVRHPPMIKPTPATGNPMA